MRRRVSYLVLLLVSLFGCWTVQSTVASAKDTVNHFSAEAILPADNRSGSNFFDLTLHPSTRRNLQIKITNNGSRTQHFYVQPNNATTNSNGIIDYSNGTHKDVTATTSLTDMLSDKTGLPVVIKGHSSSVVTFHLKTPKQDFAGTVLGGFIVSSVTAARNVKQAAGISNLAHYVLAVRLRESRQKVQPDLDYHGAQYQVSNGLPIVGVKLQNIAPVIIGKVHLKATIVGEGHKVVARVNQTNLNFAPNSSFDYHINTLGQKALKSGRYRLKMTVKADNGYWKFDKLFNVSAKDSHQQTANRKPINWLQILMWLIEALAVIIVLSYIYRRLRDHFARKK